MDEEIQKQLNEQFESISKGIFKSNAFSEAISDVTSELGKNKINISTYNRILKAQLEIEKTSMNINRTILRQRQAELGFLARIGVIRTQEIRNINQQIRNSERLSSAINDQIENTKKASIVSRNFADSFKQGSKDVLASGAKTAVGLAATAAGFFVGLITDYNKIMTGFRKSVMGSREELIPLENKINDVSNAARALGVSLVSARDSLIALGKEYGDMNLDNKIIESTSKLNVLGLSFEEAADTVRTLNLDLGITSENMDSVLMSMRNVVGPTINFREILANISGTASMIYQRFHKTPEDLALMAKYAMQSGTSLDGMLSNADRLVTNFDNTALALGKLSPFLDKNSQKIANSFRLMSEQYMKGLIGPEKINQSVMELYDSLDDTIRTMPIVRQQFKYLLGTSDKGVEEQYNKWKRVQDEIKDAGGLDAYNKKLKEAADKAAENEKRHITWNSVVQSASTIWEKITNIIAQVLGPSLNTVSRFFEDMGDSQLNNIVTGLSGVTNEFTKLLPSIETLQGMWDKTDDKAAAVKEMFSAIFDPIGDIFWEKVLKPAVQKLAEELSVIIYESGGSKIGIGQSREELEKKKAQEKENEKLYKELEQYGISRTDPRLINTGEWDNTAALVSAGQYGLAAGSATMAVGAGMAATGVGAPLGVAGVGAATGIGSVYGGGKYVYDWLTTEPNLTGEKTLEQLRAELSEAKSKKAWEEMYKQAMENPPDYNSNRSIWNTVPWTPDANALGGVYSKPTLAMIGEEGRDEVVIPTGRIREGLPINSAVAEQLRSIGVPGFYGGAVVGNFVTQQQAYRQQQSVFQSGGDPAAQRRRDMDMARLNTEYQNRLKDDYRNIYDQEKALARYNRRTFRGFGRDMGLFGRYTGMIANAAKNAFDPGTIGDAFGEALGVWLQTGDLTAAIKAGFDTAFADNGVMYQGIKQAFGETWGGFAAEMSQTLYQTFRRFQETGYQGGVSELGTQMGIAGIQRAQHYRFTEGQYKGMTFSQVGGQKFGDMVERTLNRRTSNQLARATNNGAKYDPEAYEKSGRDIERNARIGAIAGAVGQAGIEGGMAGLQYGLQTGDWGGAAKVGFQAAEGSLLTTAMMSGNPLAMGGAAVYMIGKTLWQGHKQKQKAKRNYRSALGSAGHLGEQIASSIKSRGSIPYSNGVVYQLNDLLSNARSRTDYNNIISAFKRPIREALQSSFARFLSPNEINEITDSYFYDDNTQVADMFNQLLMSKAQAAGENLVQVMNEDGTVTTGVQAIAATAEDRAQYDSSGNRIGVGNTNTAQGGRPYNAFNTGAGTYSSRAGNFEYENGRWVMRQNEQSNDELVREIQLLRNQAASTVIQLDGRPVGKSIQVYNDEAAAGL